MNRNLSVVIGVLAGAVAGYVVRGQLSPAVQSAPSRANAEATPPPAAEIYNVVAGDSPARGEDDAKVTIVEFSDFECPFCGRVIETLQRIEKTYGRDVRFVFKHNPLPMHPNAPYAARAAIAAGKQKKFWEMHDKLFAANNTHEPGALSKQKVDAMAAELGLDLERYRADVAASETGDLIASDQAQAQRLGAFGTPAFYINGAKVTGAVPFASFKTVIDAQLRRANEALARGVARKDLYQALVKDGLSAPPPNPAQPQAQPPGPPPSQVRNIDPGDGPARGGKRPKVTIVEWSDFQCPFCRSVTPTLTKLEETYKDDLRIVWRNGPLPNHPNALPAAKAAMAAARQGKFWPMHDRLFEKQSDLSEAKYEEWARELGLDLARWKKDKDSPQIASAIERDSSYGAQVGVDGTPTFFINGKLVAGALPYEVFQKIVEEQVAKADAALKRGVRPEKLYETLVAENLKEAGSAAAAAPAAEGRASVQIGKAPVLGPKSAKVTIVEWSDFQCPFCARVEPTLAELRKQYGDKIRIAWKHQPLPMHANAMSAAEAAMAAGEQGKFWQMHDKLFERQTELSDSLYRDLAREIGLDLSKFDASLAAHRHREEIQADMSEGLALGANGTPTFFINGRKVAGALPVETFKQIIDSELANTVAKR